MPRNISSGGEPRFEYVARRTSEPRVVYVNPSPFDLYGGTSRVMTLVAGEQAVKEGWRGGLEE